MIAAACCLALFLTAGCQTAYYAAWEKLGKEKRHLLRDNVEEATDAQKEASDQFKDALTRMKEMYGFDGGDLERYYNLLKDDFEESEARAREVHERVASVEQIANDLFKEWSNEIKEIKAAKLRSQSMQSLRDTKKRYTRFHAALKKAESRMDPVLDQFRDNVLYLKHNLNAQAIGALKKEADKIEVEVTSLIGDMKKSIAEAETFLKDFK
ncbi:MAG: DUF2959 domain-containing protein [Deltaproteobacteria bacterium]|nr:DUF2959 domain-containing protein [Deltaproteobacteria bacterium]